MFTQVFNYPLGLSERIIEHLLKTALFRSVDELCDSVLFFVNFCVLFAHFPIDFESEIDQIRVEIVQI